MLHNSFFEYAENLNHIKHQGTVPAAAGNVCMLCHTTHQRLTITEGVCRGGWFEGHQELSTAK